MATPRELARSGVPEEGSAQDHVTSTLWSRTVRTVSGVLSLPFAASNRPDTSDEMNLSTVPAAVAATAAGEHVSTVLGGVTIGASSEEEVVESVVPERQAESSRKDSGRAREEPLAPGRATSPARTLNETHTRARPVRGMVINTSWQHLVFFISAVLTIVLIPGGLVFIPYLRGRAVGRALQTAGSPPVHQRQLYGEDARELQACRETARLFNGSGVRNEPPSKAQERTRQGSVVRHRLVVCVYEASEYDPYGVSRLPLHLCTHVIYGSYGINGTDIFSKQPTMDKKNGLPALLQLVTVVNVPILITVGGHESDAEGFSAVSSKAETRKQFTQKVHDWLFLRDLKGINVDWRYPGGPCGVPEDKDYLRRLVRTLWATRRPGSLIALTVPHQESILERGFEIQRLLPHLHFLIVRTDARWRSGSQTSEALIDCPGLRRVEVARLLARTGLTSSDKVCYSVTLAGAAYRAKEHRIGAIYDRLGWPAALDGRNMSHGRGSIPLTQHCRTKGWHMQVPADPECSVLYRNATGDGYDVVALAAPEDWARRLERTYAEHDLGHTCVAVLDIFHDDPAGHCGKGAWPLLRTLL